MEGRAATAGHLKQFYVAVANVGVKLVGLARPHVRLHRAFSQVMTLVATAQPTLVDLLHALSATGPFGAIIMCRQAILRSTRDSLDCLIRHLTNVMDTDVHYVHGDMADDERTHVAAAFARGLERRLRPLECGAAAPERRLARPLAAAAADSASPDVLHSVLYGRSRELAAVSSIAAVAADNPEDSSEAGNGAAPAGAQVLLATDPGLRPGDGFAVPQDAGLVINYDLPPRKESYARRASLLGRKPCPRICVYFVTAGDVAAFRAVEGYAAASGSGIDVMPVHVSDIFLPVP